MTVPMIIVHGGAGNWKDEKIPIGIQEVEKAAQVGFKVLLSGGSAVDAAEACTMQMENCGKLNAGIGGKNNIEGFKELDALIADGSTLRTGAVMALRDVQNPISVARYIMEKTDYIMFAGEGARKIYEKMIEEGYRREQNSGVVADPFNQDVSDTVGCVVVDEKGRIAVTSSTGGISKKMVGRVGDSPIFGAGAFANEVCGATATGYGEHIVRVSMSRMAVLFVEQGDDVQTAAEKAMDLFEKKTGSEAGIIMADKNGEWGKATNAKAMPTALIRGDLKSLQTFIK